MRYLFLFCFLCLSVFAKAQGGQKPLKWSFDIQKKAEGKYMLIAKVTIQKGWHVFTPDPGGDGLLIPTTLTLATSEPVEHQEKLTVVSEVITKEIKEIGTVHYVEGDAEFQMPLLTSAKQVTLKGTLSYQICNDSMCLPPTDEKFTLVIK